MKNATLPGLLALLACAFLSVPLRVGAYTDNTWVSNLSSKGIMASITYDFVGDPEFTNREIPAGQADHDEYDGGNCSESWMDNTPVKIEIWVDSSLTHQTTAVACDQSIVALDRAGTNSVDIYTSVYGNINQPDGSFWAWAEAWAQLSIAKILLRIYTSS